MFGDGHFRNHDDVIKWKHFPRNWPFVRGIHRSPVNSPHKGQWRGALMFSLICVWINGWVNNREAGDLSRHRGHYDVIVMTITSLRGQRIQIARCDISWNHVDGKPMFRFLAILKYDKRPFSAGDIWIHSPALHSYTVKPVCNDHLYNKAYYLWFIQYCVWLKTKRTNLLLLTISAFWSSSRWPRAT